MNAVKIVVIALIVAGALGLAYGNHLSTQSPSIPDGIIPLPTPIFV